MKVTEQRNIEQEYKESIQELQNLYDDLFYDELKEKIEGLQNRLDLFRMDLETQMKKNSTSLNNILRVTKEDLENHISLKQRNTLEQIGNWLQNSDDHIDTKFEEHNQALLEQITKERNEFASFKLTLTEWMEQTTNDVFTLKDNTDKLTKIFGEGKQDLVTSQKNIQTQIDELKSALSNHSNRLEKSNKEELSVIQNNLKTGKEETGVAIQNLEKTILRKMKISNYMTLGVFGFLLIIMIMLVL